MNLLETFGIPQNNDGMELNQVINSVISKFQPKKPEYSDITHKEFGVLDENNKPSLFLLDGSTTNVLFSNMLFVNREDTERLETAVFGTRNVSNSNSMHKVSLEFKVAVNNDYFSYFNMHNVAASQDVIEKFNPSSENVLDLFISANEKIKGLVSVTFDGVTLNIIDVLKLLLK